MNSVNMRERDPRAALKTWRKWADRIHENAQH